MEKSDSICVCHKVSLGKLLSFIKREDPKVASQLSECLGAGTGCGWCVPFLEKLHKQNCSGESMHIKVDSKRYVERREAYKIRIRQDKQGDK
ncbi:MAG: (2Fe-2S)-binding protein [Planctomycetota bacterium]|nr:(2Fe-2S)-binding protein [Planctomycetota bacterium]